MYMKRILLAVVFFCCFLACSKEESNRLDGTSWVSSDDPTETVSFSNREVFFYYKNQLRYSANYTLVFLFLIMMEPCWLLHKAY